MSSGDSNSNMAPPTKKLIFPKVIRNDNVESQNSTASSSSPFGIPGGLKFGTETCDSCGVTASQIFQIIPSKCGHKSCSACILRRFSDGLYSCAKCTSIFSQNISKIFGENGDVKHNCSTCKSTDIEQNLHLCLTCKPVNCKSKSELFTMVLCSTCALKQHVRNKHEIVDFFPYLSAYQYESNLKLVRTKAKEYTESCDTFKENIKQFLELTDTVNKIYESSVDMLQRSNSSQNQIELASKIKDFFEKVENVNTLVNGKLKKSTETVKKHVETLKTANNDYGKNCVDGKDIVKLAPDIVEALEETPKPISFDFLKNFDLSNSGKDN